VTNKRQSNLAKSDIGRLMIIMKSCRYLLSYSPGGSTHHEDSPEGCIWGTMLWEKEVIRGSAMVPFERAMVVSYRLSTVTICRSLPLKVSEAQFNSRWVTLGQTLSMKGVDQCQPNFNAIWETWGYCTQKKSCQCFLPFEHNARTWQTDRQTTEE